MTLIPTISKVLSGDKARAAHFLGLAQRQMNILLRQMALSPNKSVKTATRKLNLNKSGTAYILVGASYNARTMRIHIPTGKPRPYIEIVKECFCNCNFTVGTIIEIQSGNIGEADLYTVSVCNNEEYYKTYENILASDFSPYVEGQSVILAPYNDMDYTCCIGTYTATGCNPIESIYPIINDEGENVDDWRTTLRIIPWCSVGIPEWIESRIIQ